MDIDTTNSFVWGIPKNPLPLYMKGRDNVRKRCIDKHFFFDKTEAESLTRKAKKAGLTEAALIRSLVSGYEPKEKPDDRFYDVMRQLSAIGNSMNQIARKANSLGFIDAPEYERQARLLQQFQLEVRRYFILPGRVLAGSPKSCKLCGEKEQPQSSEHFGPQGESDERRVL